RFDKENVAANSGPGQACGYAYLIFLQNFFRDYFGSTQKLMQVLKRNTNRVLITLGDAPRNLATDRADLALKLTQSGLVSVLLNNRIQCGGGNIQFARGNTVLFGLFRQQVTTRDLALFFLC